MKKSMRFEVKVRNSLLIDSILILKGFNKFKEPETITYKNLDSTQGHTIAILNINEDNGFYWCNCVIVKEFIFDKFQNEHAWNFKYSSLEEAINGGTLYAFKRVGILFHAERKE